MELGYLERQIEEYVKSSPLNEVKEINLGGIFDAPLIGIADSRDPLFDNLKNIEVIGPHHLTPNDWLNEAKSVISYFLPFSETIRKANRDDGLPAREWVYGRIEGEALNTQLRKFVVSLINDVGGAALAPVLDQRFSVVDRRSNWSERHVAYIAGLGTFGLSKSFITQKGCAGRIGSIVTNLRLTPTSREYSSIYDYCTMCGECIARCSSEAITMEGKHIPTCANYINNQVLPLFTPRYGCGKCQTAVPCEYERP
ncbi:MAG: epoxyqueuosine reductase [Bacillota bacterium]